jgi:hypothetical protein
MRTRTEITVEMDRWIVITRSNKRRWCSYCGLTVEMLSADEAALQAQVNTRTIFHWAESGELHSTESEDGLLLICPNSPSLSL